jgi:hypothetical protein
VIETRVDSADDVGVVAKIVLRRRFRRLALASVLWLVLLFLATLLVGVARPSEEDAPARATPPAGASIRVEVGRLPEVELWDWDDHVDPRLSRIVAVLADRKAAKVHCWSTEGWETTAVEWEERWPQLGKLGDWRAYSFAHPPEVHLSPSVCAQLMRLKRLRDPVWRDEWPDALAWSVSALAHEAVHVAAIRNEPKADCFGMQTVGRVSVMLGRSKAEGAYLAALFLKHWYPWRPAAYRSRECRNDGALDLHPQSALWP